MHKTLASVSKCEALDGMEGLLEVEVILLLATVCISYCIKTIIWEACTKASHPMILLFNESGVLDINGGM